MWATHLPIVEHFSMFKNDFLMQKQFSLLIFLGCKFMFGWMRSGRNNPIILHCKISTVINIKKNSDSEMYRYVSSQEGLSPKGPKKNKKNLSLIKAIKANFLPKTSIDLPTFFNPECSRPSTSIYLTTECLELMYFTTKSNPGFFFIKQWISLKIYQSPNFRANYFLNIFSFKILSFPWTQIGKFARHIRSFLTASKELTYRVISLIATICWSFSASVSHVVQLGPNAGFLRRPLRRHRRRPAV